MASTRSGRRSASTDDHWIRGLARPVRLVTDEEWERLYDRYVGNRRPSRHNLEPWRRCLAVARKAGAKAAIIERRYIDKDYRSEFSALYSRVLEDIDDTTQRVHFFESGLDLSDAIEAADFTSDLKDSYLGFVVCRPEPLELVGRTILVPPKDLHVRTSVRHQVHLLGNDLVAVGVPFMQQDSRLAVCAHVAAWTLANSAANRGWCSPATVAELVEIAGPSLPDGWHGLTLDEVADALGQLGLRPRYFNIESELPSFRPAPWQLYNQEFRSAVEAVHPLRYEDEQTSDTANPGDGEPFGAEGLQELAAELIEHGKSSSQANSYWTADEILGRTTFLDVSEEDYWEKRLAYLMSACLSSGLPVYVETPGHAFTVCGYERREDMRLAYTLNDDQLGPYIRVFAPFRDSAALRRMQVPTDMSLESIEAAWNAHLHAKTQAEYLGSLKSYISEYEDASLAESILVDWSHLLYATAENVHLSFNDAQAFGVESLSTAINYLIDEGAHMFEDADGSTTDFKQLVEEQSLVARTYVTDSAAFRDGMPQRRIPRDVILEYRKARLPANVMVVELLDASEGTTAPERVVAEVVLDATSGNHFPWIHILRIGGQLRVTRSDGGAILSGHQFTPWISGRPGHHHIDRLRQAQ